MALPDDSTEIRFLRRKVGAARIVFVPDAPLVEGSPAGTVIGALEVRGAPANASYALSIISDPNELVRLDGDNLVADAEIAGVVNSLIPLTLSATPTSGELTEKLIENVFIHVEAAGGLSLNTLTLSAASVAENATQGDVIGQVQGATAGSTLEMTGNAQGRFALVGDQVVRGAGALNLEVGESASITLRETLDGYPTRTTSIAITVTAAAVPPADYAAAVLARAGLVSYQRTSDGINAAGGDNATPFGAIVDEPFGPSGSGMLFDGVSSRMDLAASVVPSGTSARTHIFYAAPQLKEVDSSNTDHAFLRQTIFSAGGDEASAANGSDLHLYLRSERGYTLTVDTAGGTSRSSEQVVPDGPGIRQVAVVLPDGATTANARYYIDGEDHTSEIVTSQAINTTAGIASIGARLLSPGVYGEHFKGRIADVQVYDRALTASEIADDWTTAKASMVLPKAPATEAMSGINRNGTFSPVQSLAFSDRTSFQAFRPADSGSTLSLVETDGPMGRGGALEMVSTGSARRTYRVRYVPTGQADGARTSIWSGFGFAHGFEVTSGSGVVPVARLTSDFANSVAYGLSYDTATRQVSVVHNTGSNVVLTSGQLDPGPVAVYLEVDPTTGNVALETRQAGGSWTSQGTATPGPATPFRNIQLTALAVSTVRHSFFSVSTELEPPELARDALDAAFWGGSGTRSASQTDALAVAMVRHRSWQNQSQVRLRIIDGAATPWQTIATDSPIAAQPIRFGGLTPGQTYEYVFEVADASDNVVSTSPVFTFKTLPVIGVDTTYSLDYASCQHQLGQAGPYSALRYQLADGLALFFHHLGDTGYESRNPGFLEEQMPAVESVLDFDAILFEWASRYWQFEIMRAAVFNAWPDDHQVRNELTADSHPDGSAAETSANGFPGAKNTYTPSTTMATLWGMGLRTFDAWFPPALENVAGQTYGTNPHRYGHKVFGNTWAMALEGRFEALQGGPYISATQLAWAQGVITAFGNDPTAKLLIISSQGVFGPVAGISDSNTRDGFSGFDRAQYRAFITFIRDNVPASKSVILIGGDKHLGYNVNQVFEDTTGALIDPAPATPLLAACISSGMSVNRLYSAAGMQVLPDASTSSVTHQSRILAWYNPDNGPGGETEIIRTSAMRLKVDEAAGTVQFLMWDDVGTLILDITLNLNSGGASPAWSITPTDGGAIVNSSPGAPNKPVIISVTDGGAEVE